MNLLEVHIYTHIGNEQEYYYGHILLDCGLSVYGIHFNVNKNGIKVSYPAERDKYNVFHPSFGLTDFQADEALENILCSALQVVRDEKRQNIFGYRKDGCMKELKELAFEDFDWKDERQEVEYLFSSLKEIPIRIDSVSDKKNKRVFYCTIHFDDFFFIKNLKLSIDYSENGCLSFPKQRGKEIITMSEVDRKWIEESVICQIESNITSVKVISECENDEERLFQILWNASENGYILQSKIRRILEKNGVDWKNIYHVRKISELVEKMEFLTVRKLEPSPNHYVDWVVVSYAKELNSSIANKKNEQMVTEDLKKELWSALGKEYKKNGKIDLSRVVPYLQKEYPQILQKLSGVKLKTILKNCDFVRFEGGPMSPIYIHILEESMIPMQQDKRVDFFNIPEEYVKENAIEELEISVKKKENSILIAKNNPFAFVPNTKMQLEQNISDTALPKITANEAMRSFLSQVSHGHIDSMDLELVYWISNMQYAKTTFLYDLIMCGYIELPLGKNIDKDKLTKRLLKLYKAGLVEFYRLCSIDEDGNIITKSVHRLLMITAYGRTQLRTIGRQSNFELFMTLDNTEKVIKKLSINQWFTKCIVASKDVYYHLDSIVTARIAEANAARIPLIINKDGIPIFVTSCRRGKLHMQDLQSGEFAFWIKRISNLLKNYTELYIDDRVVEFIRKPIVIFICEDTEHCLEIYHQILSITSKIDDKGILDNLWFAHDVDIFNQFLNAHFYYDANENCIQANLSELLKIENSITYEEIIDFESEQSMEDDRRILEELDDEEREMQF